MRAPPLHLVALSLLTLGVLPVQLESQATGELAPDAADRMRGTTAAASDDRVRLLALLAVDPSLSSSYRSSAWAGTVRAHGTASEAALQYNLSREGSRASDAFSLGVIAPLNKQGEFTELADLDGLIGTTRAELAWSSKVSRPGTREFTLKATAAYPRFSYYETATASKTDVRRAALAASGGLVFRPDTSSSAGLPRWLLRVGIRIEEASANASPRSICVQVVGEPAGVFDCASRAIGAPTVKQKQVAEAEWRLAIPSLSLAASVSVAHDLKNDVTGVVIPLWILPPADGQFGGGVRLGWRTDGDRRPTLSVFVGQFKL